MDKPVICLIHTGGERVWVESCKARLQSSAAFRCHELGTEGAVAHLERRIVDVDTARVVVVLLTPALTAEELFLEAEWPALVARCREGQLQVLPIWYSDPEPVELVELEALAPFTYFGRGVGGLVPNHDELALDQVVARLSSMLAQPLARQDQELFLGRLFEEYYESLFAYFHRRCQNVEEARDLVQETWLHAVHGARDYRGEAHPRRWLIVVAHNVWENFHRKRVAVKRSARVDSLEARLDQSFEPEIPLWGDGSVSPEARVLDEERRKMLQEAVGTLPPRMHEVVVLRIAGLKYQEIADRLGMSLQTVRSHLGQARIRLGSLTDGKD